MELLTRPAPPPAEPRPDCMRARPADDKVYQVVTVCAILLVLGSLWLF